MGGFGFWWVCCVCLVSFGSLGCAFGCRGWLQVWGGLLVWGLVVQCGGGGFRLDFWGSRLRVGWR